MWYLVVNQKSERCFIREKDNDIYYFIKENTTDIKNISLQELQAKNFVIVGECFDTEMLILNKLISE